MSYHITGKNIILTRGDTLRVHVDIVDSAGDAYVSDKGDKLRFALKRGYREEKPLLVVDIPMDTMMLVLRPEDTKPLNFGSYVYDIQLTQANGDIDTVIPEGTLILTKEVD